MVERPAAALVAEDQGQPALALHWLAVLHVFVEGTDHRDREVTTLDDPEALEAHRPGVPGEPLAVERQVLLARRRALAAGKDEDELVARGDRRLECGEVAVLDGLDMGGQRFLERCVRGRCARAPGKDQRDRYEAAPYAAVQHVGLRRSR